MKRIKISKPVVILTILFIFALGIQLGVLLQLRASLDSLQQINDSLLETVTWKP